jgi:hypothetical protein
MRKLGPTAAEKLLEIVMRRYERASTLLHPPSRRNAFTWNSAQMRALERHASKRTDLRL